MICGVAGRKILGIDLGEKCKEGEDYEKLHFTLNKELIICVEKLVSKMTLSKN